jgi:hypothetical protein
MLAITMIAKLTANEPTIIRPPGLKIGSRHSAI